MSRIERALEEAKKTRHLNKEAIAEETNTTEHVIFPAKKINIMSNKTVFIGLILAIIFVSLFLFSVINYFVLKKLIESPHMMSSTSIQREDPSQQVQPQVSALPKEAVSLNGIEYTQKEIKEKSSPSHKPPKAKFTIQVGAFTNAQYAKALAARLNKKGYKVYTTPLEEKDGKLFKVSVGNFSNRQQAESLSKKIQKNENLHTFITLY
jgi:cell division septation protein DedD